MKAASVSWDLLLIEFMGESIRLVRWTDFTL
jgi:hypothetical protein